MTSLLLLFLVFLLTLGITELLRTFASWIHIPMVTAGEEKILVLPLEGHQENIEYIIRSIIFDYSAHFPKCRLKIVCLNLGVDRETQKICNLLSRDFSCVHTLNMETTF